jgi:creatinine amidohydrolase
VNQKRRGPEGSAAFLFAEGAVQLALMTWPELEARLVHGACAMLPIGSTEQHGPMGLIGTDTICANAVALAAAPLCEAIVAPPIGYTPAPFNTAFPGTVSVTADLLEELLRQVCQGLLAQGFQGVFILNGHGANLAPARAVAETMPKGALQIRSWWDPQPVAQLRADLYGAWEGMHATPSEVAITQALHGPKPVRDAAAPPQQLSPDYIAAHSGDRHGPPDAHRVQFPDGRVGSHSALASPEAGQALLDAASKALAAEFQSFRMARRAAASGQ